MKSILRKIRDFVFQKTTYSCRLTSLTTNGKFVKSTVEVFRNDKLIETMDFDDEDEALFLFNYINNIL